MKIYALLLFVLCVITSFHFPQEAGIYRSQPGSGVWSSAGSWEVWDNAWQPASTPPGLNDQVTIRSGSSIRINISDASASFVHVEPDALLSIQISSLALNVQNGMPGADLLVEGHFEDHAGSGAGNGLQFSGGSTWQLGPQGSILKTNNSSAATYRDNYEGGMSNIPPTAFWTIRYTGTGSPSFTTNNTFYPNLAFESVAGHWNPSSGFSRFQGISATATIKGNLNIGGNGSGSVTVYNENSYFSPILIQGQVAIQAGSVLTNTGASVGTGFEVWGNVVVQGQLQISGQTGLLRLSGAGPQLITGEGDIILQELEVSNPNDIQLQTDLEVQGNLHLLLGKVILNQSDLRVYGAINGANSNNFIQTNSYGPGSGGLILNPGFGLFYPIGNSTYNPILLSNNSSSGQRVRVEDVVWSQGSGGEPFQYGVVGRSWIFEGNTSGLLEATLQWNQSEERPGFDRTQCYVSTFLDGGWQAAFPGPAIGNGPYSRSILSIANSQVLSVASGGLLPVKLTYFHAEKIGKTSHLEWETANENNNDFFAIERSSDDHQFTELGRVSGFGTSHEQHNYAFVDPEPLPGNNYYRLRQVDQDGSFTYSSIESVSFPNTPSGQILIRQSSDGRTLVEWAPSLPYPGRMYVVDLSGRLVYGTSIPAGVERYFCVLPEFPSGIYVVQIKSGDRVQSRKVAVVRG